MKHDIVLSVKRGTFRSDDPMAEAHDKQFKSVRESILKRDKNTCVYCGFKAKKFQEVHHLNGDHSDNSENNLVTTCSLCHMCHHIAFAGLKEMGSLVYIEPSLGIKQEELNSLVRNLWLAEDSKNQEINSMSIEVYFRMFFRSTFIKNVLGDANPATLGNYLMSLSDDEYENRATILKGIYFLPNKTGFTRQYKHWRESYSGAMPGKWKSLAIQNSVKWYNIQHESEGVSKRDIVKSVLEKNDD